MEFTYLSESVSIKKISETITDGVFEIEGLYNGYGLTLGNALRRTLFSSLPGAAITQIKIKGVDHEFSTIPHVLEDIVEICLNLKKIRFRILVDESQTLTLKIKGEKEVLASDIKTGSQLEIISPDIHIATLSSKSAELDMELIVSRVSKINRACLHQSLYFKDKFAKQSLKKQRKLFSNFLKCNFYLL